VCSIGRAACLLFRCSPICWGVPGWAALIAVLAGGLGIVLRHGRRRRAGVRAAAGACQVLPAPRVAEDEFLAADTSWPAGLAVTAEWAAAGWVLAALLLARRDV
jgi:hypothetical protein